jgi:GTPase SAR1 family protein
MFFLRKLTVEGVGKSSLTAQFVSRLWTERYDPTIEDAFRKEIKVNGEKCVLEMYLRHSPLLTHET